MASHKGIGVNEVVDSNTNFSFYAPYAISGTITWGWFQTAAQAVAGTQAFARTWDSDFVLISYASRPFIMRGGRCDFSDGAGVLCTYIANGQAGGNYGFRPVVVL